MPTPEELELERKKKALEAQILGGYADREIQENQYGIPTMSSILGNYYYSPSAPDPLLSGLIPNETEKQTLIGQLADLKTQQEMQAMIDSGIPASSISYDSIYNKFDKEIRETYVKPPTTATFGDFAEKTAPAEFLGVDIPAAPPIETATGQLPSLTGAVSPLRPQQFSSKKSDTRLDRDGLYNAVITANPNIDFDNAQTQVDAIEEAYFRLLPLSKGTDDALRKALDEIAAIDSAPTFEPAKTELQDRFSEDTVGAFELQVTGNKGQVKDYTPAQMAYVKKTIEKPYYKFFSENREKIGEEEVDLVSFPIGGTATGTVPREVFDYLTNTNPKTTRTLISPQADQAIRNAGGVSMSAGRGTSNSISPTMGGALTSVRAINEFGDPNAWFLDPALKADIKANPDKYVVEGFFTDMDYMGKQAETSKNYVFRMGMAPLNVLAVAVQENVIEPVLEPAVETAMGVGFEVAAKAGLIEEADYFTTGLSSFIPEFAGGEPSTLGMARRKGRAEATPDYADSSYMASIALNKGLTGEFQDVSNALGLEGWQAAVVVGGGLAGDILSPDFGVLIAGSKALKGGSQMYKAQKVLNTSTDAKAVGEVLKAAGGSGLNAFAKDVNFITHMPIVGKPLAKKVIKATDDYGDIRSLVGAKTARELEASRTAAKGQIPNPDTKYAKLLDEHIARTGDDVTEASKAVDEKMFGNAKQSKLEHDATQRYLDEVADEGFDFAEQALLDNPRVNKELLDRIATSRGTRIARMGPDELADVQKLVDYHYARSSVFEAAPGLRGLDGVKAVTRKTFTHPAREAELYAEANKSPLSQYLSQIYHGRKQTIDTQGVFGKWTAPIRRVFAGDVVPARKIGIDAERTSASKSQMAELGGYAEAPKPQKFFYLEPEDTDALNMLLFDAKAQNKLGNIEFRNILDNLKDGKLYFEDFNRLKGMTIDDAAMNLQRGVYTTADISKLPPKMQRKFLDAPGVRDDGFFVEFFGSGKDYIAKMAERARKNSVPETATPDAATFEQRRLFEEVKQEASAMDIQLRNTIDGLRSKGKQAEELRELYGLDPKVIPTSEEALGAAIVGPRSPEIAQLHIPDGQGGTKQVSATEYQNWAESKRAEVRQRRLEQVELERKLPETKEAIRAEEKSLRADAQKQFSESKKALEDEFKSARAAQQEVRDEKLKLLSATTAEAKAAAQADYNAALRKLEAERAKAVDNAKKTRDAEIEKVQKQSEKDLKDLENNNKLAIAEAEEVRKTKVEKIEAEAKQAYDETKATYVARDKELKANKKLELEEAQIDVTDELARIRNADDIEFLDEADDMSEAMKAYRRSYRQAQNDAAEMFDDTVRQVETEYEETIGLIREEALDNMVARMDGLDDAGRREELQTLIDDMLDTEMARRAGLSQADFDVRSFRAQLGWSNRNQKAAFRQALGDSFDTVRQAVRQAKKDAAASVREGYKAQTAQIRADFADDAAALKTEMQKYKGSIKQKRTVALNEVNNRFSNIVRDAREELSNFKKATKADLKQVKLRGKENIRIAREQADEVLSTKKSELADALEVEKKELVTIRDFNKGEVRKSYDEAVQDLRAEKTASREEKAAQYKEESDLFRQQTKRKIAEAEEAATGVIESPNLSDAYKIRADDVQTSIQLNRLYDTADWALGRLFYHVKESTSVTDRVVGLNQLAQRNTFLSKFGKEQLDDAVEIFVAKTYENPAKYWDNFSELITEYVKILGDEKSLAPGVTDRMIEKKFASLKDTMQNEVSLGMYYWAEGDRIVSKHLVRAVNEDVIIAGTDDLIDTMRSDMASQFMLEEMAENANMDPSTYLEADLKSYILDSFNRPERADLGAIQRTLGNMGPGGVQNYNAALVNAKNWDEFEQAVETLKQQQANQGLYGYVERELSFAARYQRYVADAGDQIIRNNNLWAKFDTDADKAADFINQLFKDERMGKLYMGETVYNELNKALASGRIAPISRQLDQLLKDLSLKDKTLKGLSNFMNGVMSIFYKGVLTYAPQFHMNNITTASTITYMTTGKIVGPNGVKHGVKALQAYSPTAPRYYEIAVETPDGRLYTYGDLNKAVYAGGARSEFSMITSTINDGSLIKYIEDNNTRRTGLSKEAMNWMTDWSRNTTAAAVGGAVAGPKGAVAGALVQRPLARIGDVGGELMIAEDMVFRAAVMQDALKNGASIEEATVLARKSMFDYNNMNPTEKAFAATAFVFYSFYRQNMTTFVKNLSEPAKAKRIANILKMDNGVERFMTTMNDDKQFDPKVYMPDYTLNRTILSVHNGQDRNFYMTTPAIPTLDAMMSVAGLIASPVDETQETLRRMVSPVVRGGLDLESDFKASNKVPVEWTKLVQTYYGTQDPFDIAQTIQVITGGTITPTITTSDRGIEINGKNYIFPMDAKQAENFNGFMGAVNFVGLSRVPVELTRIMAGTGAYEPFNIAERVVGKPVGVTPAAKQDLFNLYSRRQAIQAEIRRLKSLERTRDAAIEEKAREDAEKGDQ